MSKVVALTGTSGAMGGEVLLSLLQSDNNLQVRCVFFDEEKRLPAFVKKTLKNIALAVNFLCRRNNHKRVRVDVLYNIPYFGIEEVFHACICYYYQRIFGCDLRQDTERAGHRRDLR